MFPMSLVPSVICLNSLKPLDVVVTRPRLAPLSKGIAALTSGKYSHAALVVSRLIRFEATATGLGYSIARPSYAAIENSGLPPLLMQSMHRYAHVAVYRHPQIEKLDAEALRKRQDELIEIAGQFNALRYPPVSAFANLAASIGWPRYLTNKLSGWPAKESNFGPFCSQLVAEIFEQLDLPAFSIPQQSNVVSPSAFASNSSRLRSRPKEAWRTPSPYHWTYVREAWRLLAPLSASLSQFGLRREMFANLVDLVKEYDDQVAVAGISAAQASRGARAIAAAIDNVRTHELSHVRTCIEKERRLFADEAPTVSELAQLDGVPRWHPSPRACEKECLRREPRASSLLHPIVNYLDEIGVDWAQLASQVP
jgi:hypothetical protein